MRGNPKVFDPRSARAPITSEATNSPAYHVKNGCCDNAPLVLFGSYMLFFGFCAGVFVEVGGLGVIAVAVEVCAWGTTEVFAEAWTAAAGRAEGGETTVSSSACGVLTFCGLTCGVLACGRIVCDATTVDEAAEDAFLAGDFAGFGLATCVGAGCCSTDNILAALGKRMVALG